MEKHERCNPVVSASPAFSNYVRCLGINADEYLLSILEKFSEEDSLRITNKQRENQIEPKKIIPIKLENYDYLNFIPDVYIHKGKTYKASRSCPDGEKMYWTKTSGYLRKTKIEELGCMTTSENEEYWRQYKLRQAGAPRVTGSGSGNGTNMFQQQQILNNELNIQRNRSQQQQFQWQQNYNESLRRRGY